MKVRVAPHLALVFTVALTAACATSDVVPMGNNTYLISQTSAGGIFKAMGSLKTDVMKRANAFAEGKGKVAVPIASKESPAYPGHMPNFEYQFMLVDASDPRASGGALIPRADVVIEKKESTTADIHVKDQSERPRDIYADLLKLDDLRARHIITDAEFEVQKAKILAGN